MGDDGEEPPQISDDQNVEQVSDDEKGTKEVKESPSKTKKGEEEYFCPFELLPVKHRTTYADSLIHLVKAFIGAGYLSFPSVFLHVGVIPGIVISLIGCIFVVQSSHMLLECSYYLSVKHRVPALSYVNTGAVAFSDGPPFIQRFGPAVKGMIYFAITTSQLGFCCVYIVYISKSLGEVFGTFSNRVYMTMILPVLILLNWIRSLKYLAPVSLISEVFLVISFFIAMVFFVFVGLPSFDDRLWIGEIGEIPQQFGTTLFAYASIVVMLPLQQEMKSPEQFVSPLGVMHVGSFIVNILYISTGLFGYWRYGPETAETLTLNLPQEDKLAKSVHCLMGLSILLTYEIQFYPAVTVIWHTVKKHVSESRHTVGELALRTAIVLLTYVFAIAIPRIDLFVGLVGAVSVSWIAVILPPMIDSVTFWEKRKSSLFTSYATYRNAIIFVVGIVVFFIGTISSLIDIKNNLYA